MHLILADVPNGLNGNSETTNSDAESIDTASTISETLVEAWKSFISHLPYLGAGVAILFATWIVSNLVGRGVSRFLRRSKKRPSLKALFIRIAIVVTWVAGLLLAAIVVFPGLTPTKALGGLGLLSVAVGFAFKDIFENFFAGFILLWRYPFEDGDYIECEGIEGRIETINIRMTKIRQTSGELVIVPNSTLFTNPVDVLTSWKKRRVTIMAGVSYDTDVETALEVIDQAVKKCESVLDDEPVQILPHGFGASSIDIEVTWWTGAKPVDLRKSRGEVVAKVKRALDEAGIEIPFPYRTLTFKEPLTIDQLKSGDSAESPSTS